MSDEQTQEAVSVAELLEIAQNKTRKLMPRERRAVIKFIEDAGGIEDASGKVKELSNYELADLFDVDEKIVRVDKRKILKEYTDIITPQEAMTFVGSYMKGHDDLIRRAQAAVQKMESQNMETTLGYFKALQLISDLQKRRVVMLQEIGAIPKELGNMNINEELWEAYVQDAGDGNSAHGVRRIVAPVSNEQDLSDDDDDEVFEAEVTEAS